MTAAIIAVALRWTSLIRRSSMMTASAASASWVISEVIAARICDSTRAPIRRTLSLTSPTSRSYVLRDGWVSGGFSAGSSRIGASGLRLSNISRASPSAEPARDVVLGHLVPGVREDLERRPFLDDVPRSVIVHVHEHGPVRGPCRLLHVVGGDHDRVVLLELEHQLLDLERGARIEGGARFVHEDDVRRRCD